MILGFSDICNQDNYRIINFTVPEFLTVDAPLKTRVIFHDGHYLPSNRFLRMDFDRSLAASAYGGTVIDDYEEQEADHFMEDLGIFDDEIDYLGQMVNTVGYGGL
jgi:hypothetical protein